MRAALRNVILSKRTIFSDDFGSYADSTALLTVWTAGAGAGVTLAAGTMQVVRAAGVNEKGYVTVSGFKVGRLYRLFWTGSGTSPSARVATTNDFVNNSLTDMLGSTSNTTGLLVFRATAASLLLGFGGAANGTSAYDNISVRG